MAPPHISRVIVGNAAGAHPDVPVFRAFGDHDDHLRLSVLLAESLAKRGGDANAARRCKTRKISWPKRLASLQALLASLPVTHGLPIGVFVDLDGVHPGPLSPELGWDDAGFHRERLAFFRVLVEAFRRGGWILVRPAPDPALSAEVDDIGGPAEETSAVPAEALVAPSLRALVVWLRAMPGVTRSEVERLVAESTTSPATIVRAVYARLDSEARRAAELLAPLRPQQDLNGKVGPYKVAPGRGHVISRSAVDVLRASGLLQSAGPGTVMMPRVVRRALEEIVGEHASREDLRMVHKWLAGESEGATTAAFIEQHYHAVMAASPARAFETARYYGSDLRVVAFELSLAAKYAAAAAFYKKIVDEFDAEDAYAWEYYAFNLGRSAKRKDPERVREIDRAYAEAASLAPSNPLYRGRLVGFRASIGNYDASSVTKYLPYFRATAGEIGATFFAQPVVDGLRRAGREAEAAKLVETWKIDLARRASRPAEPASAQTRRFGSAKGQAVIAPDFDAPVEGFEPYLT